MEKKAVALKYDGENQNNKAPLVVAKGKGEIAKRILDIAKDNGVTVYNDADLVESLSKLDLMQEIPADLYEAVAEVLAFVYKMNGKINE